MPTARSVFAVAATDTGKIYAIGGFSQIAQAAVATNEEYDTSTNTWTTRAPLPSVRYAHGAAFLNGKVYVVGGRSPLNWLATADVEAYDPATDTWTALAPLPTARFWLGVVAFQGKIWALGGYTNALVSGVLQQPQLYLGCDSYDPASNSWTPGPSMVAEPTTAVAGGSILALQGFHLSNPSLPIQPSSIEWGDGTTFADSFPNVFQANAGTFSYPCTVGLGGRFYVMGGVWTVPPPGGFTGSVFTGGAAVSEVVSFDPSALPSLSQSTHAPMITARTNFAAAAAPNGKIYVFGGIEQNAVPTPFGYSIGGPETASVEAFTP